jgi:alanine dehydrogenase
MRIIGPSEVVTALDFSSLIEALRQMFRSDCTVPPRQHYTIPTVGGRADASLLVMPSWQAGHHIGIKLIAEFPDNADSGLATFMGEYLLLDGRTGKPLAVLDGPALTLRRTAAASALAAGYLARPDCERLLIVGTGALVAHLVEAHAAVRPIRNVLIWGRNFAKAKRTAQRLDRRSLKVAATDDLASAVRGAHVISCATAATAPIIKGAWLPLGVHLDLVGGFTPEMREADDDVFRRGRVFVDTREAACREAGDIVQPLRDGIIAEEDIAGDLFELTRGARGGRRFHDQITIFKSVGTALEDLAAAQLALERVIN